MSEIREPKEVKVRNDHGSGIVPGRGEHNDYMAVLKRLLDRVLKRSRSTTTRTTSAKSASTGMSTWDELGIHRQSAPEPRGEKIYEERAGKWVFIGREEPELPPPYDPFMHDY